MKKIIFALLFLIGAEIYSQCPAGQYYDPVSGYCFDNADSYTEFLGHGIRLRKWAIGDNPGLGYNWNIDDIADIFLHREFEYQVNQIRVTNGTVLIGSAAKLDIGSQSIGSPSWASAKLVFEDVTKKGLVPFRVGDILFSRSIAKDGAGYDANGNIIDSDALIRQFIYEVDSVSGLNVWVIPHIDTLAPANKGEPQSGDTFVKIGNVNTGANLIELASDLKYPPRITLIVDVKSWSDYLAEDHKAVVIGNMNGLTDADGVPIVNDYYGIMIDGGINGGKAILKNVELTISGGSARDEIDSLVAANLLLGDMAYEDIVELAKLGSTIIQGGYLKTTLLDVAYIYAQAANITNTLTMGTLGTAGTIQSYGWNGTANGFQLVGGSTPSFHLIGGSIEGATIVGAEGIATLPTAMMYAYGGFQAGTSTPTMISNVGITMTKGISASGNTGKVLRSDGLAFIPATLGFSDLSGTTSVVQTTGSYSNPTWITSLAGSKISGVVPSATVAASADYASEAGYASNADQANYASSVAWSSITSKPSTFTPSAHTHSIPDVTGLATQLNTMQLQINDLNDRVIVLEGYH